MYPAGAASSRKMATRWPTTLAVAVLWVNVVHVVLAQTSKVRLSPTAGGTAATERERRWRAALTSAG